MPPNTITLDVSLVRLQNFIFAQMIYAKAQSKPTCANCRHWDNEAYKGNPDYVGSGRCRQRLNHPPRFWFYHCDEWIHYKMPDIPTDNWLFEEDR